MVIITNEPQFSSPSGSLARPYSPRACNLAGSYNRPEPPPYPPPTSLHRRRAPIAPLALEESLQLLNQANIAFEPKDPVIDQADGAEDYVHVQRKPDLTGSALLKPDLSGSGSLKPDLTGYESEPGADLDNINVPELTKYGVPGI